MKYKILVSAALSLASFTCLAQTATTPQPKEHHAATGERPIDKGPYTPDANAAYQGGGVVLQGAPGAPAPQPQATAPGQVPQGAVPH